MPAHTSSGVGRGNAREQLLSPLWAPRMALDKLLQGEKDGCQEQGRSPPDSGTEGQARHTTVAGGHGLPWAAASSARADTALKHT